MADVTYETYLDSLTAQATIAGTDQLVIRTPSGLAKRGTISQIPIDSLDGTTPLSIAKGGTGAASASAARTSLGVGTAGTLASDTDTTLAANSDSRIATQKAVKAYVDLAVTGLLDFKGATDCSTNPNYPAASKGDAYVVSVAGKIGGASGKSVDIGDVYLAIADNAGGTEASVGTSWIVLEHNLVGALLAANNLSDVANASTARTNLGLAIGVNVQAFNAVLSTLAGASANGQSLITAANYAAMKVLLGLTIGTNVQAWSAILDGIAAGGGVGDPCLIQRIVLDMDAQDYPQQTDTTGTGTASVNGSQAQSVDHPGVYRLRTGITTGGAAAAQMSKTLPTLWVGGGAVTMDVVMDTPAALSNATDRYIIRGGVGDTSLAESAYGIFVRYTDNNGSSGHYELVCRSGGVETVSDLGFTPTVNEWYRFRITINAGGTSVTCTAYKCSDQSVVSGTVTPITTNIPTANNHLMWLQVFIIRSTTTASDIEMHVDLISWLKLLTNRR